MALKTKEIINYIDMFGRVVSLLLYMIVSFIFLQILVFYIASKQGNKARRMPIAIDNVEQNLILKISSKTCEGQRVIFTTKQTVWIIIVVFLLSLSTATLILRFIVLIYQC